MPTIPYHVPVLVREVMEALRPGPGKRIVDGTLGGGGHARAFLDARAEVVGVDRDGEAIAEAERWASQGSWEGRFRAVRGTFAEVGQAARAAGWETVDGVLLDIGVSSRQLDAAERGFSFRADGPLDMRMDQDAALTAADVVNGYEEGELRRILRDYGEERQAGRIVRAILAERARRPLETTRELAAVVERACPGQWKRHPATRTFQAIRIEVNGELSQLEAGLESATALLGPGGRLAVITFHSLEDRIVKRFFHRRGQRWIDRPEWPEPRKNPDFAFGAVGRGPAEAGEDEVVANPRARSAKLRWGERAEE